jgi:hypothetical protein
MNHAGKVNAELRFVGQCGSLQGGLSEIWFDGGVVADFFGGMADEAAP